MMRTRIKICGVNTLDAARAAVDAGADAVGLMFAEGSPRAVTLDEAQRIVSHLPPFVEPVGVFMNQPIDFVRDVAGRLQLRTVQLHGREEPRHAATLVPRFVIKALSFDDDRIEDALAPWSDCVNFTALLLDAPPPTGEALTGGHGQSFDWHALARAQGDGTFKHLPPLILAGGLTPDNVADAIATVRPYAVDVSSGVESSRGVKDPQRIAAFCDAVRAADRTTSAQAPR